ncbi:3-deoxy-D-manno-octulosonic acid transferase [Parasutterella secunda]|uniref:3-deoxy-D-manno-octulosonic acid transferase n=1 Tax=Parasutterella secunda TaxID=626947 RepID=A0ABS2GRC8_9BURK|nr:3-deoxy-D-manno-octulosonic acid transferase [Parasutterella secunda]MBM6927899.1 3-deoxy-D-manno-octulosonic acid transferase [Parasutterella secunda]
MNISPQSYRFLVPALLPAAALYLLWRARKQPSYLKNWGERFAWSDFPAPRQGHPVIWVHAVSVGETNATRPLIRAILDQWPDCDILLTHMTPTGREAGQKIVQMAPDRIRQCFLPYDAVFAVRKFLKQTRPSMGLLMETEVWPTVLEEAHSLGIPMVLVNGRLSEKSYNQAMRVPDLMKKAMGRFNAVCAQAESDAERFRAMGTVEPVITGSLKFDIKAPKEALSLAHRWKSRMKNPVVMFASTRDGEEALIIEALKTRAKSDVTYLLVPRHPQRFAEVEEMLKNSGLKYQKRSELADVTDIREDTQVILGDSMGEMFFYCALSDITLMGGSFKPFGCQNVIEPTSVGVPVIVGPSTFNFSMVVQRGIAGGAIYQVDDVAQGIELAQAWLGNADKLRELKEKAKAFSDAYVGATERTMKVLEALCK